MAWDWLRRLIAPSSPKSRRPAQTEEQRRFELAMLRTKEETAALEDDGSALADRIRRNARGGRASLGSGKPL